MRSDDLLWMRPMQAPVIVALTSGPAIASARMGQFLGRGNPAAAAQPGEIRIVGELVSRDQNGNLLGPGRMQATTQMLNS